MSSMSILETLNVLDGYPIVISMRHGRIMVEETEGGRGVKIEEDFYTCSRSAV